MLCQVFVLIQSAMSSMASWANGSSSDSYSDTAPVFAVPVAGGSFPASLQLIGPPSGEEVLIATGAAVEQALV